MSSSEVSKQSEQKTELFMCWGSKITGKRKGNHRSFDSWDKLLKHRKLYIFVVWTAEMSSMNQINEHRKIILLACTKIEITPFMMALKQITFIKHPLKAHGTEVGYYWDLRKTHCA